jgi:hypothetical protein
MILLSLAENLEEVLENLLRRTLGWYMISARSNFEGGRRPLHQHIPSCEYAFQKAVIGAA